MLERFAKNSALVALTGLMMFLVMDLAFSTPVVYTSYSTNECVMVESYPGAFFNKETDYSCENLPSRYIHEWTQ